MGITSLQVCMDSSDWLQATISEDGTGMDSSPISTPTGEDNNSNNSNSISLTCSRPIIERRLRPHHEQSLKCPRCESTHTKFCYYNNYSLSQPRYFCKTCRRYWTKGGTLRNIPVGGGCRKNNKKPSKKQASGGDHQAPSPPPQAALPPGALIPHPLLCYDGHGSTDLQLAFPEQLQFSGMFNNGGAIANPNFPIEFVDNKYEGLILGNQDYMGNGEAGFGGEFGNNFNGFCSPLGFSNSSFDHGNPSSSSLENCQRLLQPYDHHLHDVKPHATAKMLSIEWNDHQQACHSDPGYNNLGSWTGLMNGYGSSATNPLV